MAHAIERHVISRLGARGGGGGVTDRGGVASLALVQWGRSGVASQVQWGSGLRAPDVALRLGLYLFDGSCYRGGYDQRSPGTRPRDGAVFGV